MASREWERLPTFPNVARHRDPAAAVEDRKDHPPQEAQQGRLHPGEGVEANLTTVDSGEIARGGCRREDLIGGGDLRAAASQPLWREETEVCGAGAVAPPRSHIRSLEK